MEDAGKSEPPRPGDIPIFSAHKVRGLEPPFEPFEYLPKVPNPGTTNPEQDQPVFAWWAAAATIAEFIESRLTAIAINGAWKDAVDGRGA